MKSYTWQRACAPQFHYTCQASKNSTLCVIRKKKKNGGRKPELMKARKQKHTQCEQPSDCHVTWERLWREKHDGVLLAVDLSSGVFHSDSAQAWILWKEHNYDLGFPDKWKKCIMNLARKAGSIGCNDNVKKRK